MWTSLTFSRFTRRKDLLQSRQDPPHALCAGKHLYLLNELASSVHVLLMSALPGKVEGLMAAALQWDKDVGAVVSALRGYVFPLQHFVGNGHNYNFISPYTHPKRCSYFAQDRCAPARAYYKNNDLSFKIMQIGLLGHFPSDRIFREHLEKSGASR